MMVKAFWARRTACAKMCQGVWRQQITCSGWSTGLEPEGLKVDEYTGNKHGLQPMAERNSGLCAAGSGEPLESSEWRSGTIRCGTLSEHESPHRARRLSRDQGI